MKIRIIKQWFLQLKERLRKAWEEFVDEVVKDPES